MGFLQNWTEMMRLNMAISTCKRIIWLQSQLHHVELIRMAEEAEKLIPKLEKEKEDAIRSRKTED